MTDTIEPTDWTVVLLECGHSILSLTPMTGLTYCPKCGLWVSIERNG